MTQSRRLRDYWQDCNLWSRTAPQPGNFEGKKKHNDPDDFFPHLPPYSPPTTGLIARLPPSWIPFAQLARLDRPAGLYAFYLPYLTGLMYGACMVPVAPEPLFLASQTAALLGLNIVLRGVACTWNDNVDQEFDRRVRRCRHRPIARGAVSTKQANVFTLVQMMVGYLLLAFFPQPCKSHMVVTVVLFFIYALMKRVTYYPQVFLGLPFAWAIFFSVTALGMDPFETHARPPTLALFAASVLWTTTYDTIYAHQDVVDDQKAGVKGMALRFKDSTKTLAGILSVGQVFLLALCGRWAGFGAAYFVCTVGGVAVGLAFYLISVDLSRPESCGAWFYYQFWIIGGPFVAGLTGEYVLRLMA